MDYKDKYESAQWELERERQLRQEYQEAEAQRYREERERREAAHSEWESNADSWEDAFNKALPRLRREAVSDAAFAEQDPGYKPFFPREVEIVEAMKVAYYEEMKAVQPAIDDLLKQARNRAADRVEQKFGADGNTQALRDDDYSYLVNW